MNSLRNTYSNLVSLLFWFPLPMFLSNSFLYTQKKVFFLWNGEDRYNPPCSSCPAPILFSKPSQLKQGRTSALVSRAVQSWQTPTKRTQTVVDVAASHKIQDYTGNCLRWDSDFVLATLKPTYSHLMESSWSETRRNSPILIHCFY